jgi:hypothetical protein
MGESEFAYLDTLQRDELLKECHAAGISQFETENQAAALLRMTLKDRLKQQNGPPRANKREGRQSNFVSDAYPIRNVHAQHEDKHSDLQNDHDSDDLESNESHIPRQKGSIYRKQPTHFTSGDEEEEEQEAVQEENEKRKDGKDVEDALLMNEEADEIANTINKQHPHTNVDQHVKRVENAKCQSHSTNEHHIEHEPDVEIHLSSRKQQSHQQTRRAVHEAFHGQEAIHTLPQNTKIQLRKAADSLQNTTLLTNTTAPNPVTMQLPFSSSISEQSLICASSVVHRANRKKCKSPNRRILSPLAQLLEDEYDIKIAQCMQVPSLEELLTKYKLFEQHASIVAIQHQGWNCIPDDDFLDNEDRMLLQESDQDNPLVKLYYDQVAFVKCIDALYTSRQHHFSNTYQALHVKIVAKQKLLHALLDAAEAKRKYIWGAVMQQFEPNTFVFADAKKQLLKDHRMDLMRENQAIPHGRKDVRIQSNSKT